MAMIAKAPIAWAKVTGKPQPGYNKTQLEWSFDIGVTDAVLEVLKKADVDLSYVKPATNPKTGKTHTLGMPYIKFTRKEIKADGSPGKPFKIVDQFGKPWDETKQIGNGSLVNVKFMVNETPQGKNKPSALAIQVWELAEYEGEEDFPVADANENWGED